MVLIARDSSLREWWCQYRGQGRWVGDRSLASCWPPDVAESVARAAGLTGYLLVAL